MMIPADPDAGIARGPPADEKDVESKRPSTEGKAERTIPIDPNAGIARGPLENEEKGKEKGKGRDEGCEDCR